MKTSTSTTKQKEVRGPKGTPQSRPLHGVSPVWSVRNILAPVDFSDCSNLGLAHATALAKALGSELDILHVFTPVVHPPAMDAMVLMDYLPTEEKARERLQELRDEYCKGIPTKTHLRKAGWQHGGVIEVLLDHAQSSGADLIVIAAHGYGKLERFLMGSTTEKLVRHASCPVLVIREKTRNQ